jgi:2-oxoglutarate ferredoxin oxidoreductase subunit alpha
MNRFRIRIAAESGAGLLSTGDILIHAFRDLGFHVVADREYPSLIKGGHSCYTLNISTQKIHALSRKVDLLLAVDKSAFQFYLKDVGEGGILMHAYDREEGLKNFLEEMEAKHVQIVSLRGREIAEAAGGNVLMTNVVLIGMIWKYLGLPYEIIEQEMTRQFADKPKLLEIDLKCLSTAYEQMKVGLSLELPKKSAPKMLMDGNKALALGAVHGECQIYYAYPMSPSSTILTHLSDWAPKTGMLVKQVEDEISVANMAIGSMHMGARTLVATSGGGFDLMTESVSLAGITETPLVVIIAQRPGPGTGLPTWTAQADLNLAVHAAHGEFAKVVMAVSAPSDAFDLIQHAFNLAEVHQTPVILLTEKVIAESILSTESFEQNKIPIQRGFTDPSEIKSGSERYALTESGLSKRWIPGSNPHYYFANGDEHGEDGSLTEEAEMCQAMMEKRMKKLKLLEAALPEPEIFGEPSAQISFVGWGSSKSAILDAMEILAEQGITMNYLHFSYLFPLKTDRLKAFFNENKQVHLIEGNHQGQFGAMVEAALRRDFAGKLLKYNGRPFFVEDLLDYVHQVL